MGERPRKTGYYWVKEPHSNIASIAFYSYGTGYWSIFGSSKARKDNYFEQIGYRVTDEHHGPKEVRKEAGHG